MQYNHTYGICRIKLHRYVLIWFCRNENATLLSTYAPNAYLIRNYQLNSQLTELQSTLTTIKDQVTEINRSRRVYQEDMGQHLSRLEGKWQDLVGGGVQLEMACLAMEGEVRGLRRREEELRKEVAELEA
jgi:pre-mRNA-splicing factor SPF27